MEAVDFKEKTEDVKSIPGMEDTILPLPCHIMPYDEGNPDMEGVMLFTSCWKPQTKEEMDEFIKTGEIWVTVVGSQLQPMNISGISPFKTEEPSADES